MSRATTPSVPRSGQVSTWWTSAIRATSRSSRTRPPSTTPWASTSRPRMLSWPPIGTTWAAGWRSTTFPTPLRRRLSGRSSHPRGMPIPGSSSSSETTPIWATPAVGLWRTSVWTSWTSRIPLNPLSLRDFEGFRASMTSSSSMTWPISQPVETACGSSTSPPPSHRFPSAYSTLRKRRVSTWSATTLFWRPPPPG